MKPWEHYAIKLESPKVFSYCEFYFYRYGEIVDIAEDFSKYVYLTRTGVAKLTELYTRDLESKNIVYQIKFDTIGYERARFNYEAHRSAVLTELKQDIFEDFGFKLESVLANKIYKIIETHNAEQCWNQFKMQYEKLIGILEND